MSKTLYETIVDRIRRQLPALILFSCLVNLLLLVSVIYMLQVYDRVLSTGSLDTLIWLTIGALGAIVIYGVIEQARRLMLSRTGAWLSLELSGPVIRRAMEARLAGAGLEAGPRDVADLRGFFDGDAALALLDTPWAILFIAFIWQLHPVLGMIAIGGALLLFGLAAGNDLATRAAQKRSTAALRTNHDAALRFIEGGETLGPLGMAAPIIERWQEREATASDGQQRLAEGTASVVGISRVVRLALQIAMLGAGAYFVLEGQVTGGAMIAGSIVLARALAPIERSISAWRKLLAAGTAHRNLKALFAASAVNAETVQLPRPAGRLSVEAVNYIVPGTHEAILGNVNVVLEAGTSCAIVGPSGAGKSTLCRLLVGAARPSYGHVRIDGADVFAWDSTDLGRHIGYLPQQIELFPGTVAQNIARFRTLDSEKLVEAAKFAGVHELILALPAGYETDIGAQSNRMSLGQRQRVALARALYDDPALLVLDEPNSNLDSDGDLALTKVLAELKRRRRTVVIVTHRPVDLQAVDKIMIMRNGAVARFADRDEVLRPAGVKSDTEAARRIAEPLRKLPGTSS
jgi:ATP-binding cassette subfamily C exporter for protease/lipase